MTELAAFANTTYTPNYYAGSPAMDGVAAPGSAAFVARGDHVHPSDTSRLALAGGTMVGFLTLNAVPSVSLHAATKGYVDTATGGSTAAIPGANYADNTGFAINQRAYISGTALAAAAFGHDRWKGGASGCTYTFAASGGPSRSITITAGTLQQVVEGASIAGGNYMLSWVGTAQGRVGAGSYAASPVAVTGIVAGANTTIEFNAGTLSQVKFEAGTVATPWVARSAHTDLANCQRFYQTGTMFVASYGVATATLGSTVYLATMRATPVMAFTPTGNSNVGAVTLAPQSASSAMYYASVTAGGGAQITGTYTASADL